MAAQAQLNEVEQANASITEQLVAKQQALEALAANQTWEDVMAASKSAAAQVSCLSGAYLLLWKYGTFFFPAATACIVCAMELGCCDFQG